MHTDSFQIVPFQQGFKDQLIHVWERSVRATHDFLLPEDIEFYKTIVRGIDFTAFNVHCLIDRTHLMGFVGVDGRKIEMLFLAPDQIGKGIGYKLLRYSIDQLRADQVEVNEQNSSAVEFYKKAGFVVVERKPVDDQGKNYPILVMRLARN